MAITSMAYGTAPDDLVAAEVLDGFPPLGNIPIYFMRSQTIHHPAIAAIENELRRELQAREEVP